MATAKLIQRIRLKAVMQRSVLLHGQELQLPQQHRNSQLRRVKVKVGFFYSATYSSNAATSRPVQSWEVAVDWQEPMVLQRKLRPSIARINVQLNPRHAASKHTTAPINRTRPSPRKLSPDGAARARKHTSDYSLLLSLSTSKG